ncbi:hypothetical protein CDL12_07387 [Handroanthus impetiginosus]|uniref:Protein FAR1-RELATED SEQUENCE n=1 Tax=Handroanthus impetiginosus TaxID=429701 RepID=A0A2G9HQX3_9LAMI|nr:hypothetical protein CDL12_07387 [Handroanthus impetiginosus]
MEFDIPKIGMEFDTEEAAYKFYNDYARVIGFSIRKQTVHKDIKRRIIDRTFCCACQGHRHKDKRDLTFKYHHLETRKGSCAMMRIDGRNSSKYKIVIFVAEHNGHDLVSPSKTHVLRSHRAITIAQALQEDDIDGSRIAPIEPQLDVPNFFYAIQVDEDNLIANIIWADAQIVADYAHFEKIKKANHLPFFVGVNHHKQTIIFGAALLYDEMVATFMWLFDTLARAMSRKQPKTILIDQDTAMAKALAIKWPKTCHRLCIWHIYQNAAIHLSDIFSCFVSFSKDFSSCIYDYDEEEEFLNAWHEILIEDHRYQELKADLRTNQSTPVAFFTNEILKRAASIYTHDVFEFFQDEVCKAYDSRVELCGEKSMNETEEKNMNGVHFKELHSLTNQLVTQGALTVESFRIAKMGLLKMIEEGSSLSSVEPFRHAQIFNPTINQQLNFTPCYSREAQILMHDIMSHKVEVDFDSYKFWSIGKVNIDRIALLFNTSVILTPRCSSKFIMFESCTFFNRSIFHSQVI